MGSIFRVTAPHDLFRPGFPPSISQCRRSLHLWYATTARLGLGNHEIKSYVKAFEIFENTDRQYLPRLDLWTEEPRRLIERNIDLQTVIQKHIRPGIFLTRLRVLKAEDENPSPNRQYMLSRINLQKVPSTARATMPKYRKRPSAEFHITPGEDGNLDRFSHDMYLAWHKLKSRQPRLVEFHIHRKGNKPNKEAFRKLLEENLHLWPDVIGKAMPEGSGTVVDPQTNFIKICWVIGPPKEMENGDLIPPENMSIKLYVRQRVQHNLDRRGLGETTKLEKRRRRRRRRIHVDRCEDKRGYG
jgi:hypothetical protein